MTEGTDTANLGTERRREAWVLGLEGDYAGALQIVELLLCSAPSDLVTLRMKGNLLEQKALDEMEYSSERLVSSQDYIAARICYEQIIQTDPRNAMALVDLGDHFKNLDAFDRAFAFYDQAVVALHSADARKRWPDVLSELSDTAQELSEKPSTAARARALKASCDALLE